MPDVEADESDDEIKDRDTATLKKHVAMLEEHFDSVQIICTRREEAGTIRADWGSGNWYARYGSVREWVLKEEEIERDKYRSKGE